MIAAFSRRNFLRLAFGALVTATSLPGLRATPLHAWAIHQLTFLGAPIVFDASCPPGTLVFLSREVLRKIDGGRLDWPWR